MLPKEFDFKKLNLEDQRFRTLFSTVIGGAIEMAWTAGKQDRKLLETFEALPQSLMKSPLRIMKIEKVTDKTYAALPENHKFVIDTIFLSLSLIETYGSQCIEPDIIHGVGRNKKK